MTVPTLHVLTDANLGRGLGHLALAEAAIAGGADAVQLREKHGDDATLRVIAARIAGACAAAGVTLVIDDRVDLAAELGVGAHVGAHDLSPQEARRRLGRHRLLGATANTWEALIALDDAPVDYIGIGPVFATSSKAEAPPGLGLARFSAWAARARHPVVAIGGLTVDDIDAVRRAGAHGVAVLGAVASADDPAATVAQLRRALR